MKAALIAQWTRTFPGREAVSLALAAESNEFFGKLAADGKITEPEWYFGTFGPNFFIIRGEEEVLREIEAMPENVKLTAKSVLVLEDFSYGFYSTGDGAEAWLQAWAETGKELGYL
jgi:hypothetical protein